jgi:hypothetical protein
LRQLAGLLGRSTEHLRDRHLRRLLRNGRIRYLLPDEPSSPRQKYVPGDVE